MQRLKVDLAVPNRFGSERGHKPGRRNKGNDPSGSERRQEMINHLEPLISAKRQVIFGGRPSTDCEPAHIAINFYSMAVRGAVRYRPHYQNND
jgi:hypothetical protein